MLHLSSFWTKAAGHWCSVTGGEGRAGLCVTSLARKVLPKTSSFAWIWCWDHPGPLWPSCSRGQPFPRGGGPTRCLPQPSPHRVPSPFPYRPPRCLLPSGVETLALETDLLLSAVLLLAVIRNQVQHHPESQSVRGELLSRTMARCCSVAHSLWATWVYMITEDPVNVSMEKNAVCVPVSCRWSCSVAKSCLTLWPRELQHAELSCPSLTFKKGKLYGIHTQLIHHSDFLALGPMELHIHTSQPGFVEQVNKWTSAVHLSIWLTAHFHSARTERLCLHFLFFPFILYV